MKKKDREENRQKESSKKKKQLNDNNQKLLNDRMKWKMQKKNIQGKQTKNLMAMKIILEWTKQNCFK
jgi:ribosomal protein L29